ncbi:MAG: hypothetical protein ACKO9V_04795, partial [Candidatus Kapaibacterium sp.]
DHIASDDATKRSADLAGIGSAIRETDSITVEHFRAVRALLRADQHAAFDSVVGEMSRMVNAAPHRPGMPPPPRDSKE